MDSGQQDASSEVPKLCPIKNVEFPPLSQQPGLECETMTTNNPVEKMVLDKCTPVMPDQEECEDEKEVCQLIPETEQVIVYGMKQVRHSNAITQELKLLLEYEQKILQQVMIRIDKFKFLRDENKRKSIEWESNYKAKVPEYDLYLTKLVNVPQSQTVIAEGVPAPVQQKILFQIVSRTTNTANRVVVQLSMEEAVANDIDLTLGDIKKHCTVMLKQIQGWLRMLKTQECHQNIVLERWNDAKNLIKEIKDKADALSMGPGSVNPSLMKAYEERLKRIEEAICKLCGPPCGTCPKEKKSSCQDKNKDQNNAMAGSQPPVNPNVNNVYDERLKAIEEAVCNIYQRTSGPPPSAPIDPIRGPNSPGTPAGHGVSPCPPPTSCPATPATPLTPAGFIDDPYFTPVGEEGMGASYNDNCPPLPPCPEAQSTPQPQAGCPPGSGWGGPGTNEPLEYDDTGVLQRSRAPPGTYPDINLVDTPGMGFPIPVAALERGGRPPGVTAPLTPPSPPPRQMGRFRPLAASSPVAGPLRPRQPPTCTPAHPMEGQPVDPALMPKIQEDLCKLGERNRKLQDLVNNFKKMRSTLTDEIDKAVRLNHKLQRDLHYVAEAHRQ